MRVQMISFSDYVVISDALVEDQLIEGKIWDAIKKKLGGSASDADIGAEVERLKSLDADDIQKIKATKASRDFHARKAAEAAGAVKKPMSTNRSIGTHAGAGTELAARRAQASRHDKYDDQSWIKEGRIDDVKRVGWYVANDKGFVVSGPYEDKSDVPAKYRDRDGGPFSITQITRLDLSEAKEFIVTYSPRGQDTTKRTIVTGRDVTDVKRKFADTHYGVKLISAIARKAKAKVAAKKEAEVEEAEDCGPLGPRTRLSE